jgi:hypothetical protein
MVAFMVPALPPPIPLKQAKDSSSRVQCGNPGVCHAWQ